MEDEKYDDDFKLESTPEEEEENTLQKSNGLRTATSIVLIVIGIVINIIALSLVILTWQG